MANNEKSLRGQGGIMHGIQKFEYLESGKDFLDEIIFFFIITQFKNYLL